MATAEARSKFPAKSVITRPALPKLESKVPSDLIAGEGKISARLIDSRARQPRDHNPAVRLQGNGSAGVSVSGKVGQHFAVGAEGGIEIAGSALGRLGNKGGEKQSAGDGNETHSGEER